MDPRKKSTSGLDHPEISSVLFHPRKEATSQKSPDTFEEFSITVEEGTIVGARFYPTDPQAPTILFFHGNGEIVEDYDDIATAFNRIGVNFFPVDYRGYGISTGSPSVSNMMRDCHVIFDFFLDYLSQNGYSGTRIVMGRSLGSASAIELAVSHSESFDGLIIESGFAFVIPLLTLVGIDTDKLGITEEDGVNNHLKIPRVTLPALIIHAELDHIIPFTDGQFLFDHCSAEHKTLLKIPNANHNNILAVGAGEYFKAIKSLLRSIEGIAFL